MARAVRMKSSFKASITAERVTRGDDRRLDDAERDRRKDPARRTPEGGVRPAWKSACWNEPQRHREHQNEQDREPEVWHGDADLAETHDHRIARAATPIRGSVERRPQAR